MHWQDVVFTLGSLFLCVTIIPMLRDGAKPPLSSSVPIAFILYVFAATYLTLGFVLAPTIEFVQACLWAWLAVQRLRRNRIKLTRAERREDVLRRARALDEARGW